MFVIRAKDKESVEQGTTKQFKGINSIHNIILEIKNIVLSFFKKTSYRVTHTVYTLCKCL